MSPFSIQQIGVLSGQEALGDALIKLPFLRALRQAWPDAKIHWITTRDRTAYNRSLRETTRLLIDEIHETPLWIRERGAEETPDFDLLIDTRGRWKLALQARWRLPHKLFIAPAFGFLFSDRRPPFGSRRPARLADRLLQLVALASGRAPEVTGKLPLPAEMAEKARRILPEGPVYIGFAPGAGNGIKRWPVENFEKVAQKQARLERVPVFILGPQEMELYDRLLQNVPEAVFPLQAFDVWGTRDLQVDHTLAIGSLLAAAVTNDSGTSHILAAADCPLVSLFGPTSAAKLSPDVSGIEILCAQDFGSRDMADIPTESVIDAINRVILLRRNT